MLRPRITVMGLFAADLTSRVPRLPHWHETLVGLGATLGPGGKASNQAIAAARLGADVSFIGKVGADAFGAMAKALYDAEGIDIRHLHESATEATGTALILVDAASGHNAIVVNPGAAQALTAEELDAAEPTIRRSQVFLTTLEAPVTRVEQAIAHARRAGVSVVLNPAPAIPVERSLLASADVVTPNEVEASALVGFSVTSVEDGRRAAQALRLMGAATAIITLGEQGAVVASAELIAHVPAFPAARVVDTTGAGDAFNGALAVALAEGRPLLPAVHFACAAASLSVQAAGAAKSMPSRSAVDALLGVC